MAFSAQSFFETSDGSRPTLDALGAEVARRAPLAAFHVLANHDAFEGGAAPADGAARARAWVDARVSIDGHGVPASVTEGVRARIARMLAGNAAIVMRLHAAPPLHVDVVPEGASFVKLGFPRAVHEHAAGLFWGDKSWPSARIALRREHLDTLTVLVEHELAHAVFSLAFSKEEQELVYAVLRPVFGSRAAMDEVFAIYTEREMLAGDFSNLDKRAPGVYGLARSAWSEDHLFTRFTRKLWFPHKPLAGKRPAIDGHRAWKKFSS
jgi:hypothetical protein